MGRRGGKRKRGGDREPGGPVEAPGKSATPAPPPEPARSPGWAARLASRLRGLAILGALALLGRGLAALGPFGAPRIETVSLASGRGATIVIAVDLAPRSPIDPGDRVILSKVPVAIDPGRSVILLPAHAERAVPRTWPCVLVDRTGRLEPLDLSLDEGEARELARSGSFERARDRLAAFDPRLKPFLED